MPEQTPRSTPSRSARHLMGNGLALVVLGLLATATGVRGAVSVEGIHLTQSVQDGPDFPLQSDRGLAVRVTVASDTTITFARLHLYVESSEVTPPNGIFPISHFPFTPPDVPSLLNEGDTINFEIRDPLFTPETDDFRVSVRVVDAAGALDIQSMSGLTLARIDCPPRIRALRINHTPSGTGYPDRELLLPGTGEAFLRGTYPVPSSLDYEILPVDMKFTVDEGDDGILNSETDANTLLWKLMDFREAMVEADTAATSNTFLYGFVGGGLDWANGRAAFPGFVAFGTSDPIRHQRTLAHLLGHNLGVADDWEFTGEIGWDVAGRLIDNPSENGVGGRVKPESMYNVMFGGVPTNETWVSPATYETLLSRIQACRPSVRGLGGLVFSGRMSALGDALEKVGSRRIDPNESHETTAHDSLGLFEIILSDDQGSEERIRFTAGVLGDAEGDIEQSGPFLVVTPWDQGRVLQWFEIRRVDNRVVLGRVDRGLGAPVASVLSPPEGAVIDETTPIVWTATDPDDDILIQHVHYSWRPGYWYPVDVDLDPSTRMLTFDPSMFPPAEGTGILRIVVSDGTETRYAEVRGLTVHNPTSSHSDDFPEPAPTSQRLAVQGSPSPFADATQVRFQLGEAVANVVVEVVDAGGRRVRSIFRGPLPSGWHGLSWDGANEAGNRVSPGVYFAHVRAAERTGTAKLVVLPR